MTISRMQNPQQLQGIGSLRQPYGLGKLVKKAFRKIKKVAKSPLGKAAIIAGLGMIPFGTAGVGGSGLSMWGRLGGMLRGGASTSTGGIGGFARKWLNPFNPKNPLLYSKNKLGQQIFSGKKLFGLGAMTAIGMPFAQKLLKWGPYKEKEEEEDWSVTPGSIANLRNQARDYYRSDTPDYIGSPFMVPKKYVQEDYLLSADGGRVGLLNGGEAGEAQIEQMLRAEYLKYRNQGGTMPYEQFKMLVMKQAQQGQAPNQMMAAGGRIGYERGRVVRPGGYAGDTDFTMWLEKQDIDIKTLNLDDLTSLQLEWDKIRPKSIPQAQGGRIRAQEGGWTQEDFDQYLEDRERREKKEQKQDFLDDFEDWKKWKQQERGVVDWAADGGRIGAQEGGLMDLGGQEKDYRENGGFVPLGEEERADDVPARLSKNEFVFTADAVRAAGGGDIDAGSEVMQNVMDNLEQGGEVSEESQGQNPAQGMYDNYEQLQSRVA